MSRLSRLIAGMTALAVVAGSAWAQEVAPPVITPASGDYYDGDPISITGEGSIYYTIDDTAPTVEAGTPYDAPFTLAADATVRAIAVVDGVPSAEATPSVLTWHDAKVQAPSMTTDPAEGPFYGTASVSIQGVEGATLSYKLNDDIDWTPYTEAIVLPVGTTKVTAKASLEGKSDNTDDRTFEVLPARVVKPDIAPDQAALYPEGTVDVVIACATDTNTVIKYTTNGSPVTAESTIYSNSFALAIPATVKAVAYSTVGLSDSEQAEAVYFAQQVAKPVIVPEQDILDPMIASVRVMVTCADTNAKIMVATGKGEFVEYDGTPLVVAIPGSVLAKATEDGKRDSEIASMQYFNAQAAAPEIAPVSGFQTGPIEVSISHSNAVVRFTTDGSPVTVESDIYTGAFTAEVFMVVRAKAFIADQKDSEEDSAQYWFGTAMSVDEPVTNAAAGEGQMQEFSVVVPEGDANAAFTKATFAISGGNGDCDMLVKKGARATVQDNDNGYTASIPGNEESFTTADGEDASGVWYVTLIGVGSNGFDGVSFTVTPQDVFPPVATPVITPNAGTLYGADAVTVHVTCETEGAEITCQIDEGEWLPYDDAVGIPVTGAVVIKAKAAKWGVESEIAIATFVHRDVTALETGVSLTDLVDQTEGMMFYTVSVPKYASSLEVKTVGGEGDCDLFVKFNARPAADGYDYSSVTEGTVETVTIENPAEGEWQALVLAGTNGYTGVELVATVGEIVPPVVATPVLTAGGSKPGPVMVEITCDTDGAEIRYTLDGSEPTAESTLYAGPMMVGATTGTTVKAMAFFQDYTPSAVASETYVVARQSTPGLDQKVRCKAGQTLYFSVMPPEGTSKLKISLTGGTGNGNLWVKRGGMPTTSDFEKRSRLPGNNERIKIKNVVAGEVYYIMLKGKPVCKDARLSVEID